MSKSITFLWSGLPFYAARQLSALRQKSSFHIDVVATKPKVPFEDIEGTYGDKVTWVPTIPDGKMSFDALGLKAPDLIFYGGYHIPTFRLLAAEAKAAGSKVVVMSDQNWTGSFRQRFLDPFLHGFLLRLKPDAMFVPGKQGRRYAEWLGYSGELVIEGLYGADPSIFVSNIPVVERPNRIVFVGQLIDRKNVLNLCRGFVKFVSLYPEWSLSICGSGPLGHKIPSHPSIEILDFVQPNDLRSLLGNSRVLILPSKEEHWGLVVHEAAASGCALILTKAVGASSDIVSSTNGLELAKGSPNEIANALATVSKWPADAWREAEQVSKRASANFGPSVFAERVEQIVECLQ
ncbi:MAG: glycosyltransferase family 4 protein [Henriciella sp.]